MAHSAEDRTLLVQAHLWMGFTLEYLGEWGPSLEHLEKAIALYNPEQHRYLAEQDINVVSRREAAIVLWNLGYPDRARMMMDEALHMAHELDQPFTLAPVLHLSAWLHAYMREWDAALEGVETSLAHATEHGFSAWVNMGTIARGVALVEQGQWEKGMALLHEGPDSIKESGYLREPWLFMCLGWAYGKTGQADAGLYQVEQGLDAVEENGKRHFEPELYRLKGELLQLQSSTGSQAETCFRQAIEVARRQETKSLELRSVMSLCRLLQQQGREEEGRQMLADVYGWFTEGFDTPDLQDAKTLLESLS